MPRLPLSLAFALAWALVPCTASAQRYFGFEVTNAHGIRAFEVLVQSGEVLEICRPSFPGTTCERVDEDELQPRIDVRDGHVELTVVGDAPTTIALSPARPFEARVMAAMLTQCFYASFADDPLDVCDSATALQQIIATGSRLAAALVHGDFRVPPTADEADDEGAAEDDVGYTDYAISTAILYAMAYPRASVSSSLARMDHDGNLILGEGLTFDVHPPALTRAVEAARVAWFVAIERDHHCDATCGGCVPLGDRGAALEERGVRAALEVYARAVDDALWARGISAWALDDAAATSLVSGVQRSAVELACGASDWGRPRFRRCATATLESLAASAR